MLLFQGGQDQGRRDPDLVRLRPVRPDVWQDERAEGVLRGQAQDPRQHGNGHEAAGVPETGAGKVRYFKTLNKEIHHLQRIPAS